MNRLRESEIKDFIRFLRPIQTGLINKYGSMCIYNWRQERLKRGKRYNFREMDI